MLAIFIKYEMIDVWGTGSALIQLPKIVVATDYFCEIKKGLDKSYHGPPLCQIYMLY